MKNIITIAAIALALLAAPTASAKMTDTDCKALGELAQTIMEARQSGSAMSDLIEKINQEQDAALRKLFRSMVVMAYEEPAWASDDMRQRAAIEFRQQWELECYKAISE